MEHSPHFLIALVTIITLGIGGMWIASRLKLPGPLVLLSLGCLAGGVLGLVHPEELMGNSLQPIISLAVGFVLFEGGMTLKLSELKEVWRSILGLLTVGVLVTWFLCTAAAYTILAMPFATSLVLASVLTVTGPTVIGPLLREIRPKGKVGMVAKWEGIVIDPVGATLAVLVFEATESIRNSQLQSATMSGIAGFVGTAFIGIGIGSLFAYILIEALRRYWVVDHLRNSVVVMFVALAYLAADLLHQEAGLVSVTVMGIWLANQQRVDIHGILEFKESISVLLIALLFIVLAADIDLQQIAKLSWRGVAFAAVVIVVVRPVAVWCSTVGSGLSLEERAFLGWFAPRGIVAAAVSSVFGLKMGEAGQLIAPATFIVIMTTVVVYGLTSGTVARWLGLAVSNPQGSLIAGANSVARAIASALNNAGFDTLLVDSNYEYVARARDAGLRVQYANILSNYVDEELDLGGLGRFMGLTSNDQINTLAAVRFRSMFGEENAFQLSQREARNRRFNSVASHRLEGRDLFRKDLHFEQILQFLSDGWQIKKTKLSDEYPFREFTRAQPNAIVLFAIDGVNQLRVSALDETQRDFASGSQLIYLGPPDKDPSKQEDLAVHG